MKLKIFRLKGLKRANWKTSLKQLKLVCTHVVQAQCSRPIQCIHSKIGKTVITSYLMDSKMREWLLGWYMTVLDRCRRQKRVMAALAVAAAGHWTVAAADAAAGAVAGPPDSGGVAAAAFGASVYVATLVPGCYRCWRPIDKAAAAETRYFSPSYRSLATTWNSDLDLARPLMQQPPTDWALTLPSWALTLAETDTLTCRWLDDCYVAPAASEHKVPCSMTFVASLLCHPSAATKWSNYVIFI